MIIWGNEKGVTILSTVIGMSIALFIIVAISNYSIHGLKDIRRIDAVMSMISLETKVLAAFANENNFTSFPVKTALQKGERESIPAFPIYDLESQPLIIVPQPVKYTSMIDSGEEFFDKDLNECDGWEDLRCYFKLEVSMEMIAGTVSSSVATGRPEWINSDLESVSPVAIWGFAYRIRLNPNLDFSIRNLGTMHDESLKIEDHIFPLPNHYILVDDKVQCDPGGVVSGIDSENGVAKCIYPSNMCPGNNPLAKQVSLKDGEVGISCVGWKQIRCPANYVVYDFRPPLFDADNPQNAGLGRCVYIGRDTQPLGANLNCPDKYTLVGTDCVLNAVDKFKNIIISGVGQ